jgi:hypothetical protein
VFLNWQRVSGCSNESFGRLSNYNVYFNLNKQFAFYTLFHKSCQVKKQIVLLEAYVLFV